MKQILNTTIVCALVLGFLSIPDVFAIDTEKLENREYRIDGLGRRYDTDGYDGTGLITQGMLWFGAPEYGVDAIHNIASDLMMSFLGGYPELYCATQLGPYTPGVDKIKSAESTECSVSCYVDPSSGEDPIQSYEGPCSYKIVFSSNTAFTGTITLPNFWGDSTSYVLTLNGKFMGKYPSSTTASGTSFGDTLRNKSPKGVRNLFRR